jgi:ferredoxin
MSYVITSACQEKNAGLCQTVCPVDAIGSDDVQFYINPATCIDCMACATVCPVDAIYMIDFVPDHERHSIQRNADFFHDRQVREGGENGCNE